MEAYAAGRLPRPQRSMDPQGPNTRDPARAGEAAPQRAALEARAVLGAVVAGVVAIALFLALRPFVPFQDLPNHIKVLALAAKLRGTNGTQLLEAAPGLAFGYTLVGLIARVLAPVAGPAAVVRWLCIGSAAAIPAAAWRLGKAASVAPAWAALLSLPLALSWPLRVGMIEYALGMPFVVLGLAMALEVAQQPRRLTVAGLAACSIGAYLAHPYDCAWLALVCAPAAILVARRDRRALLGVVGGVAAAAPLALWDLVNHRLDMISGAEATLMRSPLTWRPLDMAFAHIVTRGLGVTGPAVLYYYVPFVAVLVFACAEAIKSEPDDTGRRVRWALVAAATMSTLGTVALPDSRENVFLIGSRPIVLGIVFWAVLAGAALPSRPRLRAVAAGVVALVLVVQLREVGERSQVVTSVIGDEGPGRIDGAFLPVQIPRCSVVSSVYWGDYDPLRHVWAYALGPEGVAPYLFAGSRYQPVWFREDALKEKLSGPNDHLLTGNETRRDDARCASDAQDRLRAAAGWRGAYAGVVVTGRQPEVAAAIARSGLSIERQIAPGMYVVERGGTSPDLNIEFGTLRGTAAEFSGFYAGELVDGRTVQWSRGKSSTLRFPLSEAHEGNLLRVEAKSQVPMTVGVVVNGSFHTTLAVAQTMGEAVAFVPGDALKVGTNEIELDYPTTFVPNPSDGRELAVLYANLSLRGLGSTAAIDAGTPAAAHALREGFSGDETIDGKTAVWSNGASSLVWFDVLGGAPGYVLELRAKAIEKQSVTAVFENGWSGSFPVGDTWGTWQLFVRGDAVHPGRNAVRLSYEKPVRPSEQGKGDDDRLLAVAYDALGLEPAPSRLELNFSSGAAQSMLSSGFGGIDKIDGEKAVWSTAKTSEIDFITTGPAVSHTLTLRALGHGDQRVTVSWSGGEKTVLSITPGWSEYSVVVPAGAVRPGQNVLTFTYDAPSTAGDDKRLLGVAFERLTIEPVGAEVHLTAGRPSARRALTAGWSGADEIVDQRPAVWSVARSSDISVPLEPAALGDRHEVEVGFDAAPTAPVVPEHVDVYLNDEKVGSVDVTKGWNSYTLTAPATLLHAGFNLVRFRYARVASPADFGPDSTEKRPLAIALGAFWIK